MESLNIKLEKANAMLRYKKRQRVTTLFRFIEFCIFFAIISRFSTQLPLNFKGLGFTIISPRFVFVLGNIIVIILFLISGQSSTKDGSTNNVKIDMYDEFKQKCLMNKDTYCEQSKKQSTGVQDTCCCEQSKKQRTLLERQLEKKIHRSHSDNSLSLSLDEKKPRKKLTRSATLSGTVRSQSDTAYGANFELQRREADFPIGQVQSTLSMSVIKWRGDLALGFNSMAQFAVGRNSKVAVRAGINNKLSGQVTVRTSSSDHLSLALTAIIPTAIGIYRKLWPDAGEKYSIY